MWTIDCATSNATALNICCSRFGTSIPVITSAIGPNVHWNSSSTCQWTTRSRSEARPTNGLVVLRSSASAIPRITSSANGAGIVEMKGHWKLVVQLMLMGASCADIARELSGSARCYVVWRAEMKLRPWNDGTQVRMLPQSNLESCLNNATSHRYRSWPERLGRQILDKQFGSPKVALSAEKSDPGLVLGSNEPDNLGTSRRRKHGFASCDESDFPEPRLKKAYNVGFVHVDSVHDEGFESDSAHLQRIGVFKLRR
ncbi:hypothetical protein BU15DRAFT_68268 [Melanogaster broomeanus]|nr:hypothetical protein BU15DRAFT_68268 [Melanogaster broomeanus]